MTVTSAEGVAAYEAALRAKIGLAKLDAHIDPAMRSRVAVIEAHVDRLVEFCDKARRPESTQCAGTTADGRRCGNPAPDGQFCWHHIPAEGNDDGAWSA